MKKATPAGGQGYTLIEMVIVIAIFVLIFAAGYSNLRSYSQRQQFNAFATRIKSDVIKAHESAVAGDKPALCTGVFNGYEFNLLDNTKYEIRALCSISSYQTYQSSPDTQGLTISVSPSGLNPIIFKALAQGTSIPVGGTASIVISYPGTTFTKSIIIGSNGNVQ